MIISASYRTDIPAFHGDWFLERLAAGEVTVKNPYSQKPMRVDLSPEAVDGYVFWTRNARPFARALEAVAAQAKPFVVHYTILGYPPSLDANVIAPNLAIENARAIAERYGPRAVVWRYDPILLTPETEIDWHRANFAARAGAMAGISDEVVVSFAQIYAKSARNLTKAGITWRVPDGAEQAALIAALSAEATRNGMTLSLCTQPELSAATGIAPARCIDAKRLSDLSGPDLAKSTIGAHTKGNRPGCLCAESRDIGGYNSCVHGCHYCYAVADHALARKQMQATRQEKRQENHLAQDCAVANCPPTS
jgi:hypothetical protein